MKFSFADTFLPNDPSASVNALYFRILDSDDFEMLPPPPPKKQKTTSSASVQAERGGKVVGSVQEIGFSTKGRENVAARCKGKGAGYNLFIFRRTRK